MWCPIGEQLRDLTIPECPIHRDGGAGHDNSLPLCTLISLENRLLNVIDKGDCDGRKGPVET